MASEVIKLNLIPKGEMPVFHASQFDTGRLITCELYRGEDAYSVPEGYTVELHCRKVDNNIVTMSSTLINDNVVTFTSTEQLTACNGNNLCEVAILDEGYRIGTLNFILEVEIDPLKGGITSTSEIHNLETQVEEIVYEAVSENFYDKTEVDYLLSGKADASSVYTKTQVDTALAGKADASSVYTKTQVDTALAGKADVSDLPDMDLYYTKIATDTLLATKADASTTYTKTEVNTALALKANAADVYTKTQVDSALALKANAADVYTKSEVYNKTETYSQAQVDALIDNIFPTLTASGAIATFTTALAKPLVSVTAAEGATTVTACGVNLFDSSVFVDTYSNKYTAGADGSIEQISTPSPTDVIWTNTSGKSGSLYIIYRVKYATSGSVGVRPKINYTDGTNEVIYPTNTQTYTNYTLTTNANKTVKDITTDYGSSSIMSNFFLQVSLATASDFTPYNGQTVPVADATTLITKSGVNNVFTNSGDVTVQYKYMSI